MTSRMIRHRPSAFSRYFVKPMYMQNLKPAIYTKNQQLSNIMRQTPKVIKTQKRHYACFQPRKPDKDPTFWLLVILGISAILKEWK
jgi:hypothetical protein